MGLFHKPQFLLMKDAEDLSRQIAELKELEPRAQGKLKVQIQEQLQKLELGAKGEDEILFNLKYSAMDMVVLRDLYIESGDLSAQIDYFIITPQCKFIVECKNLYGNITIDKNGAFIRSYTHNGKTIKEGIESPFTQNERHLLVLKNKRLEKAGKLDAFRVNKFFDNNFKSLIVLSNSKTILNDKYAPKEIKGKVIRADNLVEAIKKACAASELPKSNFKALQEQGQHVLEYLSENRTDFVARYRVLVEEQEAKSEAMTSEADDTEAPDNYGVCPRCSAKLVREMVKTVNFWAVADFQSVATLKI